MYINIYLNTYVYTYTVRHQDELFNTIELIQHSEILLPPKLKL
jgi:hypothetical protein